MYMTEGLGHVGRSSRHVRAQDVPAVEEPHNLLRLRPMLTGGDSGDELSVTWVQLDGRHRRLRVRRTTRTYYVLSGAFTFHVGGEPPVVVSADDVLLLERDAAYWFEGRGRYLVLNTPAFSPDDDEYLEDEPVQRT